MSIVRSGKAGWVGTGKPNTVHPSPPRLLVASGTHETFLRQPVPGDRGENVTQADLALVVASSAATGSVTFTIRRVADRVPWSDLTNVNKPGVVGATATAVVSNPVPGMVVTFDIAALAQVALDGVHYGWKLTSSSASLTRFYGFDTESGPTLDIVTSAAPAAATDLVPDGVGSKAKPFLQWTAPDLNGGDDQVAFRVQIAGTASPAEDGEGTWTAPTYDSGTVTDPSPELDLSATAYAGVADGAGFYFQVRWQSESGLWAPWSETAHYVREVKPTWTFTNPTAGEVDSSQPTFSATLSSTLKAYRFRLALDSKPHRIIADSRKQRATTNTATWVPLEFGPLIVPDADPITLQDGETYRLTLEGWRPNSGGYVASVGDPIAVRDVVTFTVNEATGVEAPVLTSVTTDPDLPVARLTFTRSTMPDSFVIYRNGKAVETVDAADAHVSGTTYTATDVLATPMREHDYQVRAQVDGAGLSARSSIVAASVIPVGVWLLSKDLAYSIQLGGEPPTMPRTDAAGVYVTQGENDEVRQVVIRSGRGKVDGSYEGQLAPLVGERSAEAQLADLAEMYAGDEPVTLIAANTSLRVRILDVSTSPDPDIQEGREMTLVSFRYVEVG